MQYVKCVVVGYPFVGKTAMVRTYVGDKRWPGLYDTTVSLSRVVVRQFFFITTSAALPRTSERHSERCTNLNSRLD